MERKPPVRVCAAVIRDEGKILMCSRPPGSHLEGFWEFPGGKVHPGESDAECLVREIREELSAEIMVLDLIGRTTYSYPEKDVEILFYRSFLLHGAQKIRATEKQEVLWVKLGSLPEMELVPGDVGFAGWLASGAEN